jgi:hypothetical protein
MNTIVAWWLGTRACGILLGIQDFLSGKKTYLLTGAGAVGALANLLVQFSQLPRDPSVLIEWGRHLSSNPDALVLWHALIFMAGRAAVAKNAPAETVVNGKEPPK